mmetsp:Transcript_33376/g.81032  ORF Transcript_33376/g.81032 Transcript_33376/m.81032 type:complete len:276 (+) Transcript_33376:34-861(+)
MRQPSSPLLRRRGRSPALASATFLPVRKAVAAAAAAPALFWGACLVLLLASSSSDALLGIGSSSASDWMAAVNANADTAGRAAFTFARTAQQMTLNKAPRPSSAAAGPPPALRRLAGGPRVATRRLRGGREQYKFTDATNDMLVEAQQYATSNLNTLVEAQHIAFMLFNKTDLGPRVLTKVGKERSKVLENLQGQINRLPQVSSHSSDDPGSLSTRAFRILDRANQLRDQNGDSHIAVDHVLIALAELEPFMKDDIGVTKDVFQTTVSDMRGGQK